MKIFIMFLLSGILIFPGFSGEVSMNSDKNERGGTYLALGDSYTIGEKVSVSERWPVQLVNLLNEKGIYKNTV